MLKNRRAKTEKDKSEILAEINNIQTVIKELRKYDKYCKKNINMIEYLDIHH